MGDLGRTKLSFGQLTLSTYFVVVLTLDPCKYFVYKLKSNKEKNPELETNDPSRVSTVYQDTKTIQNHY